MGYAAPPGSVVLVVLVVVVLVVVVLVLVVAAGVVVAAAGAGAADGRCPHVGRLAWSWVTSCTRWAVIVEPSASAWTLTVSPTLTDRMPSYWASTRVEVVTS